MEPFYATVLWIVLVCIGYRYIIYVHSECDDYNVYRTIAFFVWVMLSEYNNRCQYIFVCV